MEFSPERHRRQGQIMVGTTRNVDITSRGKAGGNAVKIVTLTVSGVTRNAHFVMPIVGAPGTPLGF